MTDRTELTFRRVMPGIGTDHGDALAGIQRAIRDAHTRHRVAMGLSALIASPALDRAAALRSNDMATKGYFAHATPDADPGRYYQILGKMGFSWQTAGENLYGVEARLDTAQLAERAFAAWLNSPSHRENVEYSGYRHIGISVHWRPDIGWNYVVALYAEGLR